MRCAASAGSRGDQPRHPADLARLQPIRSLSKSAFLHPHFAASAFAPNQSTSAQETKTLDDRVSKPYGVRTAGAFRLTACHLNRMQAKGHSKAESSISFGFVSGFCPQIGAKYQAALWPLHHTIRQSPNPSTTRSVPPQLRRSPSLNFCRGRGRNGSNTASDAINRGESKSELARLRHRQ